MIPERKKVAGQNFKAKATGLKQKDRIQELVGSPTLNKQSGTAGYDSNHRLSRDRSKACAVLLRSILPRLGIPPPPVASCSLSPLLGVTSFRGRQPRIAFCAGARGDGARALSEGGVAARNPFVTWSPQGASEKVGTRPWSESQPVGTPVTAGRGGWERGCARFCGHPAPGLAAALSNCSHGPPREGVFLRVV